MHLYEKMIFLNNNNNNNELTDKQDIQGVIESCTDILTMSYWLHVELGKNI
jgi:hypothetical protein